jgi:hypothetical protein
LQPGASDGSAYGQAASTITGANADPLSGGPAFRSANEPDAVEQKARIVAESYRNGETVSAAVRQPAHWLRRYGLDLGKSSVSDVCPTRSGQVGHSLIRSRH